MDFPASKQSYSQPGTGLKLVGTTKPITSRKRIAKANRLGKAQIRKTQHLASKIARDQDDFERKTIRAITGIMFTQMSPKAGIKRHGDKARDALREEFKQMIYKRVYSALEASSLTKKQKQQALRAINVIKEKRCGRLKGRHCADGRPQRGLYDKSETFSPTASQDSFFLTLVVDADEGSDVATADIAGVSMPTCGILW
jgi:hypothetical protein